MPSGQKMMGRKSTITNAFVCALIPSIEPTIDEIEQALNILAMTPDDVRCAYCGDRSSEWDHLRPLVLDRKPTGYISEIGNLVPSCGKCNQSKRNKPWQQWMRSDVGHAPATRKVTDLELRITRLTAYEQWRQPVRIDFISIVGEENWTKYWTQLDRIIDSLAVSQAVAMKMRESIDQHDGLRRVE